MLHLQQELPLILQDTLLDLDMILHQFPPPFAQTDQPLLATILMIIPKLPTDITNHLIITFILHQLQLTIQIPTNTTLKLIQFQHTLFYRKPTIHKEVQFRIFRFNRYRICKPLQYSN